MAGTADQHAQRSGVLGVFVVSEVDALVSAERSVQAGHCRLGVLRVLPGRGFVYVDEPTSAGPALRVVGLGTDAGLEGAVGLHFTTLGHR
tara:strand:+ start:198 stop:467 length:270 start_codon:yes stop_codon:yes gene_type:complete